MQNPSIIPLVVLLVAASAGVTTSASAQSLRAAPSPRATVEVTLNPVDVPAGGGMKPSFIRLNYGQPQLRGRTLHTDSLVPYDKPWRTGANAATRLTTEVDLVVGGTTLAKGTYVLFTLPSRSGWKLIVQKNGPDPEVTYNVANDITRIDLKARSVAEPVESLSMTLIPSTGAGAPHGEFRIAWGTFVVSTEWSVK